ncbi:MAG: HEAT repeat domain-containing protein [Anaerolineae bacterium]
MSLPGGAADKIGNLYELYWTVNCFLDVLEGTYTSIRLEPPDENGVEFWLKNDERIEYHQAKRHNSSGKWSIADLDSKGILRTAWEKLNEPLAHFRFISISDAYQLRNLSERAADASSWDEFEKYFLEAEKHREAFNDLRERLAIQESETLFERLKRIHIETIGDTHLRQTAERRATYLVSGEPSNVVSVLIRLSLEQVHHELSTNFLWDYLDKQGFQRLTTIPTSLNNDIMPDTNALKRYLLVLIESLEKQQGVSPYVDLETESELIAAQDKFQPLLDITLEPEFEQLVKQHKQENNASAPTQQVQFTRIQEVIEKFPSFVLIGEPGAGKTTTLRRLALETAHNCLKNVYNPALAPIPLYLSLPNWQDDQTIEDFLETAWQSLDGEFLQLISLGYVLVYLDGLNEMGAQGSEKAKKLRAWIHGRDARDNPKIGAYKPKYVIVTCRHMDYVEVFDLQLPIVIAKQLDDTRIRKFAENYLEGEAEDFLIHIFPSSNDSDISSRYLLRLARNPFLLTALIFVFKTSSIGDLPKNTGALFKDLVTALWKREERRGIASKLTFGEIEYALARLAFSMIDSNKPTNVTESYATFYIMSGDLLKIAEKASYISIENGQIRFYHQLMQEYFAAVGLNRVGIQYITGELETSGRLRVIDSFSNRLTPNKWSQVIIALSGIVDNPQELISRLAISDPILAQDCIRSGIDVSHSILVPRLNKLLNSNNPRLRSTALFGLGRTGDITLIEEILEYLGDNNQTVWDAAIRSIAEVGVTAIPLIVSHLRDANDIILGRLGLALIYMNASVIPNLISYLDDENARVRATIASVFGRKFEQVQVSPSKLPVIRKLIDLLRYDEEQDVRISAADALGDIGDETASLSLQAALRDKSELVRQFAAEALGKLKDKTAVDKLIELLRSSNFHLHNAAYKALKEIKTSRAMKAVRDYSRFKIHTYKFAKMRSSINKLYSDFGAIGLLQAWMHHGGNHFISAELCKAIFRLSKAEIIMIAGSLPTYSYSIRRDVLHYWQDEECRLCR